MYLYGKEVAESIKQRLIKSFSEYISKGNTPKLAIVQLEKDDSLSVYLRTRTKIATELGVEIKLFTLENPSFDELKELINSLNSDDSIWGIMIDEPFPKEFNKSKVISLIDPLKDVEGLNWSDSLKKKYQLFVPVAQAVFEIINYYNVPIKGKKICQIGYSKNVGKPLAQVFKHLGGEVTVCDENTVNIECVSSCSDLVCVAIGKREHIKSEFVSKFSTVFDIGVHYDEDGKLCGDVCRDCYDLVENICPSPRGIGPVTNVILFDNLLKLQNIKENK